MEIKQYTKRGQLASIREPEIITRYDGGPPNQIILVTEGKCRRKLQLGEGRVLYENYFPLSFIGLEDYILNCSRRGAVGAYADTHYCSWDVQVFEQLMQRYPEVACKAIFDLSRRLRFHYAHEVDAAPIDENQVGTLNFEDYEAEFYDLIMNASLLEREDFLEEDAAERLSQIFPPGEYLLRQGVKSQELYAICKGRVRVSKKSEYGQNEILVLGEGDMFGDMAQFGGVPYSADVVAIERTEVLVFTPDNFDLLFRIYPYWTRKFIEVLAERLEKGRLFLETIDLEKVKYPQVESLSLAPSPNKNILYD